MVPSSMTKEQTMSPLRARMIEDMKLAGLAATTQEIYLQAVRSLAKHYNRSPEREEMLPGSYFHVTVTVPEDLRPALRRYQIDAYGALMKAAAEAIIVLARDPRWVGGTVGVLAVLH